MVKNHYRWDFIGLSTDTKPTPETSEKVVDGSTFYCSDNSKLYVYCKDNWYERKPLGGGGGGTTYTAGENITIENNVISATDTTYSDFTGTDGTSAGVAGLVPAPATADAGKFLCSDGSWQTAGGVTELSTSDYNANSSNWSDTDPANFNCVALWKLDSAIYKTGEPVMVYTNKNTSISSQEGYTFLLQPYSGTEIAIYSFGVPNIYGTVFRTRISDGYSSGQFNVIDNLLSTSNSSPLAASQGKVLKDLIDSLVIKAAGAPTTSTTGTVGQLYEDTTNGKLYQCTAVDNTDPNNPSYTWSEVGAGGSGLTVVQTTGTSTTDVMSQKAVTEMVFKPNTDSVQIGSSANAGTGSGGMAIGAYASASGAGAIALGDSSVATGKGVMGIGVSNIYRGYNNSNYRLLTGLYDGQDLHDAATVAQGNTLATSAPDTSTVGVLGQLWTDTTNMHTYQCTAISGSTYTWTQRW